MVGSEHGAQPLIGGQQVWDTMFGWWAAGIGCDQLVGNMHWTQPIGEQQVTIAWWAASMGACLIGGQQMLGMTSWWATRIVHDLWLVGSACWAQPFGWWAVGIGCAVGQQALHNLVVVVKWE